MSLETPSKIRELQIKLYRKAKTTFVSLRRSQSESRMPEIGTSGLTSGDGKRGGAPRQCSRPSSTLPTLFWRPPSPGLRGRFRRHDKLKRLPAQSFNPARPDAELIAES